MAMLGKKVRMSRLVNAKSNNDGYYCGPCDF